MNDVLNSNDSKKLINNTQNGVTEKELSPNITKENKKITYQSISDLDDVNIEGPENVTERIEISKLGYVMFVIFGLTMLCAWNLWITAVPFFKNRLGGTIFQDNFQNYISIMFMFTNTLCSFITLKIQEKCN